MLVKYWLNQVIDIKKLHFKFLLFYPRITWVLYYEKTNSTDWMVLKSAVKQQDLGSVL